MPLGLRRRAALALVVACFAAGACSPKHDKASPPTSTTRTTAPAVNPDPHAKQGETITPDPHATTVRAGGAIDETDAFRAAMDEALRGAYRRPNGPSGQPQAVVYVPPGIHRILRLTFPDNVRLEVDAGAVLEQAGGRNAPGGKSRYLIVWDGKDAATPLRNVSLVGVGENNGGPKTQAEPVASGWNIANAFTMDLDPATTDSNEKVAGIEMLNVDGFLVQNLFSIQNASAPTTGWPTSAKAVMVLRPRDDSPLQAPFAQPHNGTVLHHYNIGSPRGYGPNQIGAGDGLRISGVFSQGGTALRLETDATKKKAFGGEIRGLRADTIEAVDCNRAVSFAPHAQDNYDVAVRGVVARGCSQGVIESDDEKLGKAIRGGFFDSTISDVTVTSGTAAQNPAKAGGGSKGAWALGPSQSAFARDETAKWSVAYSNAHCSGSFAQRSDRITLDGAVQAPSCA